MSLVRVTAEVNGVKGTFILDTGASYLSLKSGFAERAKIPLANTSDITLSKATGLAKGKLSKADKVALGKLEAANVETFHDWHTSLPVLQAMASVSMALRGMGKTPLIRIGFPIFDRHHHHRFPVWGYQGGLNVLVKILDKIFDEIDRKTNVLGKTDYSFDIIR